MDNKEKITEINLENLKFLEFGARFLGSGGGGSSKELREIVQKSIQTHGPISLIGEEDLNDTDYVLGVEFIGAPLPESEHKKFPKNPNIKAVVEFACNDLDLPVQALLPVEIGGGNCFAPIAVAHDLKLPILDGDLLGRAFPYIPIVSTNAFGIIPPKVYISDPMGGNLQILTCQSYDELEFKARNLAISYGTYAAVMVSAVLKREHIKKAMVRNTISQAINIGIGGKSLVNITDLLVTSEGQYMGTVTVEKVDLHLKDGFLQGTIKLFGALRSFIVTVKNEYLELSRIEYGQEEYKVVAKCPIIINLVDYCGPLLSHEIKNDQIVYVIISPAPSIWKSKEGKDLLAHYNL